MYDLRSEKILTARNLIAFWLFGLCNNYGYVIMLSAAEDIMKGQRDDNQTTTDHDDDQCTENITRRHCTATSTADVLLADIIPTLIVKLAAPFFMHRIPFGVRHAIVIGFQTASYLVVAFSSSLWMSLLGVVFASIGAGLGEITYLSMASHFTKNVISTWSSGTGGAGIIGSFAYAGLTEPNFFDLSPTNALLVMLIVPLIFACSFWFLMAKPGSIHEAEIFSPDTWIVPSDNQAHAEDKDHKASAATRLSLSTKLRLIVPLLRYMIPLGTVYMAEYFINQGLVEFVYFKCDRGFLLSRPSQYRWYQVIYQLGVFISRSSVNVIEIKAVFLPILTLLQCLNAAFFLFEAIYLFVPHISIVFGLIFFEGLLGGAAYVNTFHQIHKQVAEEHKEYSLGVASLADSTGIVVAGFGSLPVHSAICFHTWLPP